MPTPTFTEGQRVYHRQLKWYGTYACESSGESADADRIEKAIARALHIVY